MLRELGVVLKAVGAAKAAGEIGKVDKSIAKLGRTAGKGIGSAVGNLSKLGFVAGGIVASQAAIGIKTLAELETLTKQTNATIDATGGIAGVTADQVRKLANELESVSTVDDKVIQSGANVLLTYTQIGKDVFPRAMKAANDYAVAMAKGDASQADVAASAKAVGRALADPTKAAGALRKMNVVLDKETQKRLKTLAKQGKLEEAQAIILTELEKRYKGAGEAAGQGAAGDFARFQDAVEEAQMALASGLLPVIREFTKWLTTRLSDPKTMAAITAAGKDLARFLNEGLVAIQRIPWDEVGTGMRTAAGAAKGLLDAFLGLPPWVQQAVVTGWGLNKLTGGALGSIVGQLGAGLVKGVLGMSAAVVNLNAATVNGGVPGIGNALPGAAPTAAKGPLGGVGRGVGNVAKMLGPLALFAGALELASATGGYRPTGVPKQYDDRMRTGGSQPVTVNVSVNVTAREAAKQTAVKKSWSKPGIAGGIR